MKKKFVAIDTNTQKFYNAQTGNFVSKFNTGCLMDYKKMFDSKDIQLITVNEDTTNIYLPKKRKFVCEICKCKTPIECEGAEPNTCADCMPLNCFTNQG